MSSPVPSNWYEGFFTDLPNEFWRRAVPPEATAADIAFIEDHLALPSGSRVLDVPCGSGRHALALAAHGHSVTGVDISSEALTHARLSGRNAGLEITFVASEMRDLPSGPFDAAICMGNSFGYLDATGTADFAQALASAVRPGGGLVVDFSASAESILPSFNPDPRTMQAGDITVTSANRYDIPGSRLVSTYQFAQGDREETAVALHHVFSCAQIGAMLSAAGFHDLAYFAGTDGRPFTLGEGRLLLTARR